MRLKEREMVHAQLVKRVKAAGGMGSRPEAFSDERTPFRASLIEQGGEMETAQHGLNTAKKIRLLACGVDAKAGDGVYMGDDFYIVLAVERWTAHVELVCEARM